MANLSYTAAQVEALLAKADTMEEGSGTFVVPAEMKFGFSTFTTFPSDWDWSNMASVTAMSSMFHSCSLLTSVPLFDTSSVTAMSSMFNSCSLLTSVPLFDTSSVTNMGSMFYSCSSLTSVPLFDTSRVTSMYSMFNYCSSLTSVPLFDTSRVTSMYSMFNYCSSLTSVPSFDTSRVTSMYSMFNSCSKLVTVTELNMTKCTTASNVSGMFSGCSALKNCSLRNLKVSISFSKSPSLTAASVAYMINNSAPTSAITITLHATAYARAIADADVQSALANHTLVTLASA